MQALPSDDDTKPLAFGFRRSPFRRASDGWLTDEQAIVLLTLLFWASTYSLFSVRSLLFPSAGIDVISAKRLLTTFVGAMLFLVAIVWIRHASKNDRDRHKLLVIFSAIVASAGLLGIRIAYNDLAEPYAFDLGDHGRWILVWSGYFLAALSLFSPEAKVVADTTPAEITSKKEPEEREVLWVQKNKQRIRLQISRIEWVEAQGNYVYVHAAEASGILRNSLSSLEERLQLHGFIRVHRSALCQERLMKALRRTSAGTLAIVLESGTELSVGRRYASAVAALMSA